MRHTDRNAMDWTNRSQRLSRFTPTEGKKTATKQATEDKIRAQYLKIPKNKGFEKWREELQKALHLEAKSKFVIDGLPSYFDPVIEQLTLREQSVEQVEALADDDA